MGKQTVDQSIVITNGVLNRRSKADLAKARAVDYEPFVSIHVPCCSEPPELVIQTIEKLKQIDYPKDKFEILVIDNNTKDEALWRPVAQHISGEDRPRFTGLRGGGYGLITVHGREYAPHVPVVKFVHFLALAGAKAGAMNKALALSDGRTEVVAVVDCDYHVEPDWIREYVKLLNNPFAGFVQMAQDYRDSDENVFKRLLYQYYMMPFKSALVMRNEDDASFTAGPMALIKKQAIIDAGGWDENCITEDHAMGFQLHAAGYAGYYFPITKGRGTMPGTFEECKKQRFRWCAGPLTMLRDKLSWYLPWRHDTLLTWPQKRWELEYAGQLVDDLLQVALTVGAAIAGGALLISGIHVTVPPVVYGLLSYMWTRRLLPTLGMLKMAEIPLRKLPGIILVHAAMSHTRVLAAISGLTSSKLKFIRASKFKEATGGIAKAYESSKHETWLTVLFGAIGAGLCAAAPSTHDAVFLAGGLALYRAWKYAAAPIVASVSEVRK